MSYSKLLCINVSLLFIYVRKYTGVPFPSPKKKQHFPIVILICFTYSLHNRIIFISFSQKLILSNASLFIFQDGAILIFLPGWDDISTLHDMLQANPVFRSSNVLFNVCSDICNYF